MLNLSVECGVFETVGNTVGLDDVVEARGQQRGCLQIGDGVVESPLRDVSVASVAP